MVAENCRNRCDDLSGKRTDIEGGYSLKVLVVIDVQNDFVSGSLGTNRAEAIIPNVVNKIQNFRGDAIAVTQDTHSGEYLDTQEGRKLPIKHCIDGTVGWMIEPNVFTALRHRMWQNVVNKSPWNVEFIKKNTFGSTGLCQWLSVLNDAHGIEEIEVIGLCTDICVVSNVLLLKAFLPEVPITVDASCCAGATPEGHAAALMTMKACQINVTGE